MIRLTVGVPKIKISVSFKYPFLLFIAAFFICSSVDAQNGNSELRKKFEAFFQRYDTDKCVIKPSTLTHCTFDNNERVIHLVAGGGFPEQQFTDDIVRSVYDSLRRLTSPYKEKNYRLVVEADGKPIEELVPNALRKGPKAKERLFCRRFF